MGVISLFDVYKMRCARSLRLRHGHPRRDHPRERSGAFPTPVTPPRSPDLLALALDHRWPLVAFV